MSYFVDIQLVEPGMSEYVAKGEIRLEAWFQDLKAAKREAEAAYIRYGNGTPACSSSVSVFDNDKLKTITVYRTNGRATEPARWHDL